MILLTLINISFGYNNNDFKKTYTWHEIQPQIVLCHDAKVNVKSVKKAMKFWKELGFKMKDDLKIKYCNESNYHKNEIRIAGQRNLDTTSYYAITDRAHQDIYMNSAIIKIENNYAGNDKLLIHELGHALGVDHADSHDTSHIMHQLVVENTNTRLKH